MLVGSVRTTRPLRPGEEAQGFEIVSQRAMVVTNDRPTNATFARKQSAMVVTSDRPNNLAYAQKQYVLVVTKE